MLPNTLYYLTFIGRPLRLCAALSARTFSLLNPGYFENEVRKCLTPWAELCPCLYIQSQI